MFRGTVMAQSILRRRGTGPCPTRAEQADGSPADGRHCLIAIGGAFVTHSGLPLVGVRRGPW